MPTNFKGKRTRESEDSESESERDDDQNVSHLGVSVKKSAIPVVEAVPKQGAAPQFRGKEDSTMERSLALSTLRKVRHGAYPHLLASFDNKKKIMEMFGSDAPDVWKDEVSGILFGLFSETSDDAKRAEIANILERLGIDDEDIALFETTIDNACDPDKLAIAVEGYKVLAGKMKQHFGDDGDQSYLFFLFQAQLFNAPFSDEARTFGGVKTMDNGTLFLDTRGIRQLSSYFGEEDDDLLIRWSSK